MKESINYKIKEKIMGVKSFGLPYTGSKSRIAPWLMEMLPDCDKFIDVFAGGCAVSHAMMLYGKAKAITLNDVQGDIPALFLDALHGNLEKYDPYRWIDRTTFFEQKDSNPFIRLVYSFGNNGKNYLFSREVEEFKHAVHLVLVDDDWALFSDLCPELSEKCKNELLNFPISIADYNTSIHIRHLKFKKKCLELLCDISGNNWYSNVIQQNPYYKTSSRELNSLSEHGSKIVRTIGNQELYSILRIVGIYNNINNFPVINATSLDYRLLDIPTNSVVFCDPPYRSSSVKYNKIKFDHEEFYEWCLEKAKYSDVYVTEYKIEHPHFQLVGEKGRQISFNSQGSKGIKVERLYKVIP